MTFIRVTFIRALLLLCLSVAAVPVAAQRAGTWTFDDAPSYPGVTMLEVEAAGAGFAGTVTTSWYGPMTMQKPRVEGDRLVFELRNLNDRARPVRTWTARFVGDAVTLSGDIWSSHVEQTGRPATAEVAAARRFRLAPPLPPLKAIAPDGLAATPPMGWSSWNTFAERIDDATVRAMADALVSSGLREAGYIYVNIDDGWQGQRGADGVLRPNVKFPDMKALAEYIHARGLKMGLYSSQGPKTCAGYEGSYGHVAQDARTFADWGVDYLKYDLCSGEWFYDDADSVRRSYQEMGAALKATGRPIIFSVCEYGRFAVSTWGRLVGGHLWRTTGDITDDYATMSDIGFVRNPKFQHAGPGGWNDPDMLEVGNGGMSHDEYVTHMTLWVMQAAPLVMGHDLRKTSPAAMALLANRAVIAIDQDTDGVQGRAVRKDGETEIWRKPLHDGSVAIALFNRGKRPRAIALQPADTRFATVATVDDVWTGKATDRRSFVVPPHGAVLLKVGGVR